MKKYEIIPHTSDLRLKVQGLNLEDLFKNALEGMNSILKEPFQQGRVQQNINDEIESISNDSSALLVDFLSGVLTLSHTKKAIFSEAIFSVLNDNYFKAEVHGNSCDGFDEDIKAVTYGETNIVLNMDGLYESVILFDI